MSKKKNALPAIVYVEFDDDNNPVGVANSPEDAFGGLNGSDNRVARYKLDSVVVLESRVVAIEVQE